MKKRTLRHVFAGFLAASMVVCILPVDGAAASSKDIQREINALKDVNTALQAEIDALQVQVDVNSGESNLWRPVS